MPIGVVCFILLQNLKHLVWFHLSHCVICDKLDEFVGWISIASWDSHEVGTFFAPNFINTLLCDISKYVHFCRSLQSQQFACSFVIWHLPLLNGLRARQVRVIRLFRFVLKLRTLITSIASTLTSLFWAMILLTLVIYVAGRKSKPASSFLDGGSLIMDLHRINIIYNI